MSKLNKKFQDLPYNDPKIEIININDNKEMDEVSTPVKYMGKNVFAAPYNDGADSDSEGCEFGGDSSDIRLKENIKKMSKALDKILKLNGYEYNWKDYSEKKQIGLIAQEVKEVFPELVYGNKDHEYLLVNYRCLVAPIIESIKELNNEIQTLKEENKYLRDGLNVIARKNNEETNEKYQ